MARKTRPYVKIDQSLGDHPRVLQIAPELYMAAVGLHVIGIGWCDRMRTDGRIQKHCLQKMVLGDPTLVLDELLRVGLWTDEGDYFEIHDYLEYQDSADVIASKSESAKQSASRRWSNANGNAKRIPIGNATEPTLAEPIQEQGQTRANALPPCLSTKFPKTRWSASDDSKHDTAAQAFWASVEQARGGLVPPEVHGRFCAAVSDTCPARCSGSEDEVDACLTVLEKAATKTKGQPSPLFRRICEEDR